MWKTESEGYTFLESKRGVGEFTLDLTALTPVRNECGWIARVVGSGKRFAISPKSSQMFLEVNSDQEMDSLPTLLFFKIH